MTTLVSTVKCNLHELAMKVVDVNTQEISKVLEDFKASYANGSVLCVLVISHSSKIPSKDNNCVERVKGRKLLYLCTN